MNGHSRYYLPLDVPAYSVIWEAVMWVSFGRFPEGAGYENDDELNEELGLLSLVRHGNFGSPRYRFRGFWWYEAEMAGAPLDTVDWERYETALRSGYQRQDALESQVRYAIRTLDYEPADGFPSMAERNQMYLSTCEHELKELPYVESVHAFFQQSVERGWSRIFQALTDGALKAYGWGEMTQDEIRERAVRGDLVELNAREEGNVINPFHLALPTADTTGPLYPMTQMAEIPVREWSFGGVAPDGRYITAAGRNWWDVCISTSRLLELFPRPLLSHASAQTDTIEVLNPGVAISSEQVGSVSRQPRSAAPSSSGGRGRRKLADGEIERACLDLYGARWAAGENKDALLAEASAHAQVVWGETLARSTFQGYMSRASKVAMDQTPKIAAE